MRSSKPAHFALLCALFLASEIDGFPQSLGQTAPLDLHGDLAARMVDGIHRYLDRATDAAAGSREKFWNRDFASAERYNLSVAPNRDHLRLIIGATDQRLPATDIQLSAGNPDAVAIASGAGYKIYAVRWPVFEGVDGEGLLLEPGTQPVGRIVTIPDADWTPEMLTGLAPGVVAAAQYSRRLAENGTRCSCRCSLTAPIRGRAFRAFA